MTVGDILPLIIPLFILQLALMISALVHALKHRNYKFGNVYLWVAVIIFVGIIGSVLYFAAGRGDDEDGYD